MCKGNKDTRARGLAATARSDEQIGVTNPSCRDLVLEGGGDVLLPDDVVK